MLVLLQTGGFGLIDGAILALAAVGLSLQFGITNYVNFAYGEFMTFAAFIALDLQQRFHGLPIWAVAVVSVILTGLLLLLIARILYTPLFQRRPQLLYALVMTFSAYLVLNSLWIVIWGTQTHELRAGGATNHSIGPFLATTSGLYFLGIALVVLGGIHGLLHYTKTGRTMRAMSDNKDLATVCGLNTKRTTNITWFISGCLAGLAGVIFAIHGRAFDTTIGDTYIYLVFAAVVIGGIGRVAGAVAGAVIIGIGTQWAVPLLGAALSPTVVFGLLVILMIFRPNGLFGATGRSQFGASA